MTPMRQHASAFAALVLLSFGAHPAEAQTSPSLGNAAPFAVLAGSTVTNTGPSVIGGNVGVSPGAAITGFPPGTVSAGSTLHGGDATAANAQLSVTTAYNALASQVPTQNLTGQNLGGLTLTSGVYRFDSSAQLTGNLVLDAQGSTNSAFIFQIGSALTTASNSSITMINGGSLCNVYWQVGSSATLGTTTSFIGNILALTSITLNTGATIAGRALARNGAVTLDTNTVTVPSCAGPPPCPIITLSPATLPSGIVGTLYSQVIGASGSPAVPITFSILGGALPPGLTLNPANGAISGTPTAPGTFTFTIAGRDAAACVGNRTFAVTVAALPGTGGGPAAPIPTLAEWAMILLVGLVAIVGFAWMRRRQG
jgi:hypothetical protein